MKLILIEGNKMNEIKIKKSARQELFEQKRILTFTGLKTKNKDWEHAKVINYSYNKRTNRSNKLIEEWIPVYKIPNGYKNPFESDVIHSKTKRCQLCDNPIINYGIIIHHTTKLFLVVGLECYELYEGDSDRRIKLQILMDCKKEYIEKLMVREKKKITSLNKKAEKSGLIKKMGISRWNFNEKNNYTCYSTIIRDRWLTWSKVKFNNFLVKYSSYFGNIGYLPCDELGMKNSLKYYRELAKAKIRKDTLKFRDIVLNKMGKKIVSWHRSNQFFLKKKNSEEYTDTMDTHVRSLNRKVNIMEIELLQKIIKTDFSKSYDIGKWEISCSSQYLQNM